MGRWSIDHLIAEDGVKIRYGIWRSGTESMGRCVVFLNGRTEWIEKYDYLPESLGLAGDTGFLTLDHRGQGASGGPRAHVDSMELYAQDAAAVVTRVLGEKIPYVLMSHSMGGLVSIFGVMTKKLGPQSVVLSSPLLGLPEKPVPKIVARPLSAALSLTPLRVLSSGAGQFCEKSFDDNQLTHSREMFERIQNTPYPLGGVTFGWVYSVFKGFDLVFNQELLKALSVPVLVLEAQADVVVDNLAASAWVERANLCAKARVQLAVIPGARHELLAEDPKYRDDALGHIKQWFASFLK